MMRLKAVAALSVVVLLGACDNDPVQEPPVPEPPFKEPVAEMIECTQANVVYYGDDGYTGVSDLWQVTLYTDMDIDEKGNPIGAGQIVCISCNAKQGDVLDMANLVGTYTATISTGDFRAGTFNEGYMRTIDLPGGAVEIPDFSFFGDLAEGETTFEPDLLREGYCQIESNADGTYTVSGIMVGTEYLKRYFTYTGAIEPVDRSDGGQQTIPNTTLTEDILLEGFTQARLQDMGDYFFLQDQSYRMFRLTLADEGVDISGSYPEGEGRFLKLEFFVEWAADVTEGMPVGTYDMCQRTESGGIERSQIVPWHAVPGLPDQFTSPSGSWYQKIAASGEMPEYARLAAGRVMVGQIEGVEGGRRIVVELLDCDTDRPHAVKCTVEMTGTQMRL